MPAVITPSNLGVEFDLGVIVANKISVTAATAIKAGKVALSTGALIVGDMTANNDVKAVTPLALQTALATVTGPVLLTDAFGVTLGHIFA